MKNVPESERIGLVILNELSVDPDLLAVILFGSAASNRMHAESDVDIAVLYIQPLDATRKMELIERLSNALSRQVDLIDLNSAAGVILRQILCEGTLLLKRDASAYASLLECMIDNQTDMMPYYTRTLKERVNGFAHG